MQEHFFAPRGISYRTNAFQDTRPTLVFIHGLSGSSSAWFSYERLFEQKYNLLTFDLRGHGRSSKPARYGEYALQNAAEDLGALFEHLHIEKCVLISHSYGTLIALEFLSAHAGSASKAIFLSPTAYLRDTKWYVLIRTIGALLVALFRMVPFHPAIRGRVDYARFRHTGDWNLKRIWSDIRRTTLRIYLYCLMHAYVKNYDAVWKNVRVPTFIMHGTEDSIIPMHHAVRLAKEIEGSEIVLLTGANHIIVLNNIQEVSTHIESFIGR